MMKKLTSLTFSCIYLTLLFFIPSQVFAQNWWESKQVSQKTDTMVVTRDMVGENKVVKTAARSNWEQGYIEVMAGATADMSETINLGQAYSVATKTARHLAYEKLAETVAGLNLFSDATYDRELMVDSNLRTVLKAMIRNAIVVKEEKKQFNDGSIWVEVTLGMKMFSKDGLIKPSVAWAKRNPVKISPAPGPEPVDPAKAVQDNTEQTSENVASAQLPVVKDDMVYTGLIIDAAGRSANPAMLPKIFASSGNVLYGTGKIDKNYIIRYGLMGYQKNIENAKNSDRIGKNPLIVTALNIKGKNRTDFVISNEDAAKIKMAASKKDFLKECRVIAVLN